VDDENSQGVIAGILIKTAGKTQKRGKIMRMKMITVSDPIVFGPAFAL
jgi:hypothetical protein